ncbi:MAG TPA: APC family permease [Solirubrobacteraceae bacterium]|nr:APC family permease [Solirubrobacteraceae bacterium]
MNDDRRRAGAPRASGRETDRGQKRGPDASVSAGAELPALDRQALTTLREVGRSWGRCMPPPEVWERSLPVDRHLDFTEPRRSSGGRFVPIRARRGRGSDELEATPKAAQPDSRVGKLAYRARRVLLGPPLRSTAIAQERMGRLLALAVLSPDALSSVAYGPEAMLAILVLAGAGELKLSLPIGAALAVLMLAVGLGYRQVIRAYPHGGGSYIVASDSLGAQWGLLAGAGLIVDYILTVAVSVASGVEAVTSALPSLASARVEIGLVVIALLVAGNMRGVRDAGAAFAAPTYLFVAAIALIVIAGLVQAAGNGFHPSAPAPHRATEALGVLLVLRAFASGATAMTGIEVISNAVPVFRPPQARHARQTLTAMMTLLVAMFVGVVLVAHFDGASPNSSETVLSQIAHSSVGSGVLYGFVQLATTLVLLVAANSAFNGFPRLLFFMARDSYAPRQFLHMGDRLAFTTGILVLALPAAVIFAGFGGRTGPLIPLFAIGVFLAFTLAQSGMVAYWLRHRERGWRAALATNLVGAILSGAVVLIAGATKLTEGAWVVVVLVPLIILGCRRAHAHYETARSALTPQPDADADSSLSTLPALERPSAGAARLAEQQDSPDEVRSFAVVPVAVLDLAALHALAYAASLAQPVLALHVSPSQEEASRFHRAWRAWGEHLPLEVVVSPYRATVAPLANYIAALHRQRPDVILTLVVPELIVAKRWQRLLHNRVAARLRSGLIGYEGIVITTVPFHLPP